MRVVFWGSPEFAVAVLEELLASAHEVAGVVTRPPEPGGRGRRPRPTPVARLAESAGLETLTPKRLRGETLRAELAALGADVFLVAAYGAILPPDILSLPTHGSLNVHASLLPEYRGAAPVTRAILDGRSETGVTIMRMEEGLDTGAICLQAAEPVLEARHGRDPDASPRAPRRARGRRGPGPARGGDADRDPAGRRARELRGQGHDGRGADRLVAPGRGDRTRGAGVRPLAGRVDDLPRRAAQGVPRRPRGRAAVEPGDPAAVTRTRSAAGPARSCRPIPCRSCGRATVSCASISSSRPAAGG